MKTPADIQEIITGCCNKQASYQRKLVSTYSDFLYAICCRYMPDRASAKDQLQIALFKILKNIEQFSSDKGKLESWMSRIVINTCLSDLKKNRLNVVALDEALVLQKEVDPIVIDQMNAKEIIKIIQSLPNIYREIFNLIEIDGYNHIEVAETLGIKESSSRARLSRAKELLRTKLNVSNHQKSWINLA